MMVNGKAPFLKHKDPLVGDCWHHNHSIIAKHGGNGEHALVKLAMDLFFFKGTTTEDDVNAVI